MLLFFELREWFYALVIPLLFPPTTSSSVLSSLFRVISIRSIVIFNLIPSTAVSPTLYPILNPDHAPSRTFSSHLTALLQYRFVLVVESFLGSKDVFFFFIEFYGLNACEIEF